VVAGVHEAADEALLVAELLVAGDVGRVVAGGLACLLEQRGAVVVAEVSEGDSLGRGARVRVLGRSG
jgi:hypothetical protein